MASLYTKIKLYLEANSKTWDNTKVSLQNNSNDNGDFIASWSYDISEPTAEQLATYETAANTEEANNTVIATRKSLYGSWESQLEEINEQGIDSWKARIAQIKSDNPKE
nr:phage protein XkdW-like protein [uncultured Mediterranean phage uvMED]